MNYKCNYICKRHSLYKSKFQNLASKRRSHFFAYKIISHDKIEPQKAFFCFAKNATSFLFSCSLASRRLKQELPEIDQ